MAKFKLTVSTQDGKSKSFEVDGVKAQPLIGKRISEVIDGSALGFPGLKLQITGGSDKDGFPMRGDVHGGVRARILLADGPGFNPMLKGERRRKHVRGNVITEDIAQVNLKALKE
jgi:small subunit ribosomal protein S6e